MEKPIQPNKDENPRIGDEVLRSIALLCASEIEGVSCTSDNLMKSVTNLLRPGAPHKGVRVTPNEEDNSLTIDLSISVSQGKSIPSLVKGLQSAVKDAVEKMTNFRVTAVNVNVSDIDWETEQPAATEQGKEE
ncbi:MAG TPA: Asp23/Gls24 family envelope stress response protein [bacterium]|nr:Asp23/Gls24 family envelope stress response protein [bacterium]